MTLTPGPKPTEPMPAAADKRPRQRARVVFLLSGVLTCVYFGALVLERFLILTGNLNLSLTGASGLQTFTFGLPFPFSILLGIAVALVLAATIWSSARRYRQGTAEDLSNLGRLARQRRQPEDAEMWYREGLKIARQSEDAVNTASLGQDLGVLLIEDMNAKEEGRQLLAEAVRIYEQLELEEQVNETRTVARTLGCEV